MFNKRIIQCYEDVSPDTLIVILSSELASSFVIMIRTYYYTCKILLFNTKDQSIATYDHSSQMISKRISKIDHARGCTHVGFILDPNVDIPDAFMNDILSLSIFKAKLVRLFVIGKLKIEKLANFPEIEIFVNFGCPLRTFSSESFHVPLVSCYEYLLTLSDQNWSGDYSIRFTDCVSLLSKLAKHDPNGSSKELVSFDSTTALTAQLFSLKTFRGLCNESVDASIIKDTGIHKGARGYSLNYDYESK